jgi:cytochrome c oxidase subunit 4
MSDHVVPIRVYVAVFSALMVLTILTVAAARMDFGAFNTPIALTIAIVKALLVIAYFMHVKYGSKLVWLTVAAGFFWMAHLFGGTLMDYSARGRMNPETRPADMFMVEDK